jgi:tRNA-splicing ligase RtcB
MEQINRQLLSWASILEDQAREQAIATSTLPFISPHVALMPDAHWGMGSTVGSVIPTVGCVMPAAVGVDIGCGMAAVRTQLTAPDIEGRDLTALRIAIQDRVPVSPGVYRPELTDTAWDRVFLLQEMADKQNVEPDQYSGKTAKADWRLQLGTLGGGNHFVELCLDEADRVWVFLHSGSRGVGNRIAKHHVAVAQKLCERWHVQLPHRDLAFLPQDDDNFWPYIRDLRWAQAFALANRAEMVDQVFFALEAWFGEPIRREETINTHHNYTEQERHFGKDVWLTRKGAINAELGNRASFNSAPHGAGRNFSRTEARRRFTAADLAEAMKGIEWRSDNAEAFVDEIPGAYKDIDQIMVDAADLVSVEHTLRQFLNVKGE